MQGSGQGDFLFPSAPRLPSRAHGCHVHADRHIAGHACQERLRVLENRWECTGALLLLMLHCPESREYVTSFCLPKSFLCESDTCFGECDEGCSRNARLLTDSTLTATASASALLFKLMDFIFGFAKAVPLSFL